MRVTLIKDKKHRFPDTTASRKRERETRSHQERLMAMTIDNLAGKRQRGSIQRPLVVGSANVIGAKMRPYTSVRVHEIKTIKMPHLGPLQWKIWMASL